MVKRKWIYDLETLNIFTATFIDKDSDETRVFVIADYKDEREALFDFLDNEVSGLIGYNCLFFDAQILEYLYRNPKSSAAEIRNYAEDITSSENRFRMDIPEWKLRIPHLDLYKIHHFDNKNRMTGLKWCEFGMDLENIEDLPSQGKGDNWEEMVLSYNYNDVYATKELFKRTLDMIKLRIELSKMYNLNLLNASNSKIGSEILLELYCQRTGKYKRDVRSLRTYRKSIHIDEIIFPYIKFKYDNFNSLLDTFKSKIVSSTKGELEFSTTYKGFKFDYGSGGIHGSLSNKIVESDDKHIIIDSDVSSLYPSIAVVNEMYPQHLGREFYEVYKEEIVDKRLAEKRKKSNGEDYNKAILDGFKEAANATYGKSNDVYSWLYDPLYTLKTTVNGQLMLSMLAEMVMDIEDSKLIQINTDGLTIKIPRNRVDDYYKLCEEWESITKLSLEHAEYSKMIIFDVNNYISVYTNGKYKAKGRCEFENIPLHKNKSYSIIPLAVYNYFVHNISIEDTIYNHTNIFDFCAGVKAKYAPKKGYSHFELHYLSDGELKVEKLSKTIRYFISTKGKYLIKKYQDGSYSQVEAPEERRKDWKVTYFNKYYKADDFKNYNIDYSYYISAAREWINSFNQQKTLF